MAKLQTKSISDLKLDAKNANRGTERRAEMLDRSLAEYGAGRSVLLDREGHIITGGTRLSKRRDGRAMSA